MRSYYVFIAIICCFVSFSAAAEDYVYVDAVNTTHMLM